MHLPNLPSHDTANWFRRHDVNTTLAAPGHSQPPVPSQHEKLVTQTQKWVATTFYGTMLKQMRDSPFKTDLTDGGRGGETFATMLDQHLAEKMAHSAGSKLVNAIVRKIEGQRAYREQAKSSALRRFHPHQESRTQSDQELMKPTSEIDALRSTGRLHVTPDQ